ncbi:MAG: hypothetical protein OH319_01690 [Candidatus Parvarchaeota archaeon]|nr:hypothetical protein [Candidatus Jingweiarchaeum tengchongense]MCW1297717.1 hypothetical protein [Candidatus Jingweiarchaeum tengchongense]MCW1299727.1 hypothetical protein [Candidatus Jingweiarchaeum tengchongense]MCW1305329.1 hypothetical protein [Candidatus Jingweiarchaeum tengchongense]MCW1309346.1 hypothetical protein [Candidatus Jingweiarchaeum tengchongense]
MRKTIFSILMLILMSNAFAFSTNTKIVGVRETEKGMEGVVAYLFVEVKNGSGRVFVDTLPLTQVDTQAGARLAKEVACEILQYNCSSLDFFYVIRSNFTMIGGPSASAAMTVATLAALLNKSLLSDVVITGTINPDSSIGPIGGVLEKARAARDAGATLFLIPEGQAIVNVPETKTEQIGPIIRTQTTFKQVNVIDYAKKELNLDVIEVGDVLSAFKYMTGYEITESNLSDVKEILDLYTTSMRKMASNLLSKARSSNLALKTKIGSLSSIERRAIEDIFKSAESELEAADNYFNAAQYYSSSSFSVRSLVYSTHATNLIEYWRNSSMLLPKIEQINETINNVIKEIEGVNEVDTIYDIEAIIISSDRIFEAEDAMKDAISEISNGNIYSAIYDISASEVKIMTAQEWFNLINEFNGNQIIRFNKEMIRQLVQERMEQARNSFTYASLIIGDGLLSSSSSHLKKADEAYLDNNLIFALFEALKARAEANLAMGIRDIAVEQLNSRINLTRKNAERAILRAEQRGILPLLALSYFEYSKAFNGTESLIFLAYSEEFARISADIFAAINENQTIPESQITLRKFVEERKENYQIVFAMGAILGFLVSYLLAQRTGKK